MSIWRDTVESIEYRHDVGYSTNNYANGASPEATVNDPIRGTGQAAECITFQIGVYF
jgi:hypothetical protein